MTGKKLIDGGVEWFTFWGGDAERIFRAECPKWKSVLLCEARGGYVIRCIGKRVA